MEKIFVLRRKSLVGLTPEFYLKDLVSHTNGEKMWRTKKLTSKVVEPSKKAIGFQMLTQPGKCDVINVLPITHWLAYDIEFKRSL